MQGNKRASDLLSLLQAPELCREAQALEDLLHLRLLSAPPIAAQPIVIPLDCELPGLAQREHRAAHYAMIGAPSVDVLFRPEE